MQEQIDRISVFYGAELIELLKLNIRQPEFCKLYKLSVEFVRCIE